MPMSEDRHPSRDACLRDALNQLREQRNVSLEKFGRLLNGLSHSLCPSKTADMPCLASFTVVNDEYDNALMSWNKRVQRWSTGAVEFPAWLEEPWVMALEELGDTSTRQALVNRHNMIGVQVPCAECVHSSGFTSLGIVGGAMGDVVKTMAKMMDDGVLDANDAPLAAEYFDHLKRAAAALAASGMLVSKEVLGKTIQ
ncbi:hypothetical protein R84865_000006 [Carnimonas sp. R-84865]